MFSDILQKVLKETMNRNNLNLNEILIKNLGEPPIIDKDGKLISLGKLPNVEVIEKLVSINSNLSNIK